MPYNASMARVRWRSLPRAVRYGALGQAGMAAVVLLVWRVPPALYQTVQDPDRSSGRSKRMIKPPARRLAGLHLRPSQYHLDIDPSDAHLDLTLSEMIAG
jgi:hypothetical protein